MCTHMRTWIWTEWKRVCPISIENKGRCSEMYGKRMNKNWKFMWTKQANTTGTNTSVTGTLQSIVMSIYLYTVYLHSMVAFLHCIFSRMKCVVYCLCTFQCHMRLSKWDALIIHPINSHCTSYVGSSSECLWACIYRTYFDQILKKKQTHVCVCGSVCFVCLCFCMNAIIKRNW